MAWDWQVFLNDDGSGADLPAVDDGRLGLDALGGGLFLGGGGGGGCPDRDAAHLPNSPWLVRLANVWVELFRNIPLLVQIFLWYFVVPKMIPGHEDLPGFVLVVWRWASLLRHALPSRCAPASRRCPAGSATPAWPWASPPPRPTAM
jgi:glutamate/aspartate transport system permease protein